MSTALGGEFRPPCRLPRNENGRGARKCLTRARHLTGFALFLARVVITLSLALVTFELLELPVRQRTIGRSRRFAIFTTRRTA